jgi:hypothetical protein
VKEPELVNGHPVSAGGDNGSVPPDAKQHREAFVAYVIEKAKLWHRERLAILYNHWGRWNDEFFQGGLVVPYLLFATPSFSRAYGDYASTSGWGGYGQTRIRPSLLTGKHPHLQPGDEYEAGRQRFIEDVFLHETVHQYCHEVIRDLEDSYKGHGPIFAGECNRIGRSLGLPPVRHAKARGAYKHLPSCAQWPHCVRPEGYYLGAYPVPKENKPAPDPLEEELERLRARVAELEADNQSLRTENLQLFQELDNALQSLKLAAELAGQVFQAIQYIRLNADNYADVMGWLTSIMEMEPEGFDDEEEADVSPSGDTEARAESELACAAV